MKRMLVEIEKREKKIVKLFCFHVTLYFLSLDFFSYWVGMLAGSFQMESKSAKKKDIYI
jgi:hypothetical protein